MRPKVLIPLLGAALRAKQRVLMLGKPGIGKSEIFDEVCAAIDWDSIISHPAISDPTDYKGMPAVVDGGARAEFLPFGDLNKLIVATRPTACFLDDIGQAPPAVQAALMQLVQARRVNGHRISDHVVFCGATNGTKDMAGVGGMIEPLKSRWDSIVELDVSVDDWCEWAIGVGDMPPEIIAFIRFRPELLHKFEPTREIKNSPCPRTVAAVGRWVKAGITDYDVIAGAAGEGFATEFTAFLKMFGQLPNLDAILMTPESSPVPDDPSALYAVTAGLSRKLTPTNFDRGLVYLKRLPKEFEVCCVRDALKINQNKPTDLTKTATYTTWIVKNQTVLS